MKKKYLLSIQADDGPTVLSQIIALLTRRKMTILSLSMTCSDIHEVVNINIELQCSFIETHNLQNQIEKIIAVYGAMLHVDYDGICQQVAFYKLDSAILKTEQSAVIQRYGAQVVNLHPDALVISKSGTSTIIQEMYNKLEGKYLIGFARSGMVADTGFLDGVRFDDTAVVRLLSSDSCDEARISRLAA